MEAFTLAAILLALAAVFGYLNHRYIRLPMTIALMLMGLVFSLVLVVLGQFLPGVVNSAQSVVESVDLNDTLLDIMLGYLLFAGALHVDLGALAAQKRVIAILATAGVLASTMLVGSGTYFLLGWLGFEVPFLHCVLFGALISPTDPVAVLGILKKAGAPKSLETKITGESLFNDGVGVVVFIAVLGVVKGDHEFGASYLGKLFLIEVGGGLVLGFVLGLIAFYMLKRVDDHKLEVLITLALVTGGYALATALHMSGPLAMVVSGLMIGNHGRALAMSPKSVENIDTFWELVDEILNALLFVLIGLEVIILSFSGKFVLAGLLAIPLVLLCRAAAVSLPVVLLRPFRTFSPRAIRILTWGGLRGGISVALALAVPAAANRELFLVMTYIIVIFSIAVQGMTLGQLFKKPVAGEEAA